MTTILIIIATVIITLLVTVIIVFNMPPPNKNDDVDKVKENVDKALYLLTEPTMEFTQTQKLERAIHFLNEALKNIDK